MSSKPRANRSLFIFSGVVAASVMFLLLAGAMVTSTGSGLAVPDWPLSFGQVMPPMEGGVFYEHGHRMVATAVGFLSIILAVWLWRAETRPWLRRMGWITLGLVILQGLLGGATVLLKLPVATSAAHATLAQAIFLLVVLITLALSRAWNREVGPGDTPATLAPWSTATTAAIFLQLILGAVMRHMNAGLVIPDWPTSFGGLVPPTFTAEVAVHFAHRTWAYGVALLVVISTTLALRDRSGSPARGLGILQLALTAIQITLGASVILTGRQVHVTSTHVVVGALLLAASFVLTVWSWRLRPAQPRTLPSNTSVHPGKVTA